MLFNSFVFIVCFLPPMLAAYHLLRVRGQRLAAKLLLVAGSLFFYGWWDSRYVPLIVLSIVVNYGLSLAIERFPTRARPILALGLAANLGLLGHYKYFVLLETTFVQITGVDLAIRAVALPLAISFFTFQQIAYLVECSRDRKAADSFLDYSLFVLFFPHLIAGPITHHKEMLPQFRETGHLPIPWACVTVGSVLFTLGLAKKVVLADTLALWGDPVFDAASRGAPLDAGAAWTGALAYTFQLYFDFSGYSDMAIGLGLLFGIRLPVNFASPYKATSVIEFWRRWHISLSRFLRNYLYIPLGGNRQGPGRRYANLFATMLLGGLWHGAGWTFVAWGALHGVYLVVNHGWRHLVGAPRGRAAALTGPSAGSLAGWLLTFVAVVVAWVVFRAPTFSGATAMLAAMLGQGAAQTVGADGNVLTAPLATLAIAFAAALAFLCPNALELAGYPASVPGAEVETAPLRPRPWRWPAWSAAALVGATGAVALSRVPDPGVFLYFTF